MNCDFIPIDAEPCDGKRGYSCSACGAIQWSKYGPEKIRRKCSAIGAGDVVEVTLETLGITPARVTWFLRAAKLIEEDATCGCDERRRRLNKIGARLLKWARSR